MSYDLVIWEGTPPESDADASLVYARLTERMESIEPQEQASQAIRAYVEVLLHRWPDITTDAGENSPWADGPLIANAFGDAMHLSLVWSRAEEASAYASQLAAEQGLVCYDPQAEAMRTPSISPKSRRSWFRRTT